VRGGPPAVGGTAVVPVTAWRVIITDTESLTGVAPVCDSPEHQVWARRSDAAVDETLPEWVFDCCPHPHVEMWDERQAAQLAETLTAIDAEVCS
jgi:hypothetical protein